MRTHGEVTVCARLVAFISSTVAQLNSCHTPPRHAHVFRLAVEMLNPPLKNRGRVRSSPCPQLPLFQITHFNNADRFLAVLLETRGVVVENLTATLTDLPPLMAAPLPERDSVSFKTKGGQWMPRGKHQERKNPPSRSPQSASVEVEVGRGKTVANGGQGDRCDGADVLVKRRSSTVASEKDCGQTAEGY